jgi:hypothetical protein
VVSRSAPSENDCPTQQAGVATCASCEAAGRRIPRGKYPIHPAVGGTLGWPPMDFPVSPSLANGTVSPFRSDIQEDDTRIEEHGQNPCEHASVSNANADQRDGQHEYQEPNGRRDRPPLRHGQDPSRRRPCLSRSANCCTRELWGGQDRWQEMTPLWTSLSSLQSARPASLRPWTAVQDPTWPIACGPLSPAASNCDHSGAAHCPTEPAAIGDTLDGVLCFRRAGWNHLVRSSIPGCELPPRDVRPGR